MGQIILRTNWKKACIAPGDYINYVATEEISFLTWDANDLQSGLSSSKEVTFLTADEPLIPWYVNHSLRV